MKRIISISIIFLILFTYLAYLVYSKYYNNSYNYDSYNKKTKKRIKNDIKILHLVSYDKNNPGDNDMYRLTRSYYELFDNIDNITTYYYTEKYEKDNKEKNIKIIDDIIFLNSTRAIDILKITKGIDYDYLVKSDIDTIVNFELLVKFLKNNNIDYGGSYLKNNYVDGSCIIASKKLIDRILNYDIDNNYNIEEMMMMIGNFAENNRIIPIVKNKNTLFVDIKNIKRIKRYLNSVIFYINKNKNRLADFKRMEIIINKLID
jgi:hypothetical protein